MNTSDFKHVSVFRVHYSSGLTRASTRYESNSLNYHPFAKAPEEPPPVRFEFPHNPVSSNLHFNILDGAASHHHAGVAVTKVRNAEEMRSVQRQFKVNMNNMIRCQNCEANYATKYQYQRHQCEFNAEKVVLKPNSDADDTDDGTRKVKYDCDTCGKQFVSKNNLDRHQISHENVTTNKCEHCSKQFVSENRLRIHKENHCKKAGDISKFYRSDVTVWKCKKCSEVFSSSITANYHIETCSELLSELKALELKDIKRESRGMQECSETNDKSANLRTLIDNALFEKVSTEILLQCEFCNRTFADKKILLAHQKGHTTEKNYECVICEEVFESYALATTHWLKKCSDRASVFYLPKLTYCEFCDRTFKSHELMYLHKIKKKHYTPKLHCETAFRSGNAEKSTATKAVKNGDSIDEIIQEVMIALEIPRNKLKNNKSANNYASILHKENRENVDPNLVIKIEPLTPPPKLNGEKAEKYGPEDVVILPEKKKRGRKRKLPKPTPKLNKKTGVSLQEGYKYQCERCNVTWDSINELEAHREKEHASNFQCDECGQILHTARVLLIHSRAHKSLKPYVCDTCGRSYSQTSHLWQHMRFHQGIKPFACPHEGCEARYTIRPDLKDHIRKVHTRERPFKCNVCGKCFLTGSVYYQHRLIHTEDRRYGCTMCEKRFFRADALNNHKRIHTNERPYPCYVCGRLFRQKGDRNKHVRTQHPDAIVSPE